MEKRKTYIQQTSYNGSQYTKGEVVDIAEKYGCVVVEFPPLFPKEMDEIASRKWAGEDGCDIYIPERPSVKEFDVDITFGFVSREASVVSQISSFIRFITGRNEGATGGRLTIYDTRRGMGRKDMYVKEIDNDLDYHEDYDDDVAYSFKVKFAVCDPTTDITPVTSDGIVTDLQF